MDLSDEQINICRKGNLEDVISLVNDGYDKNIIMSSMIPDSQRYFDLHHAKTGHRPAPQLTAHFKLAFVSRLVVIGGHGLVTGIVQGIQPLRWLDRIR